MRIESLGSGSAGNCYWVSDGETPLLIEAGLPRARIAGALMGKRLARPEAILVSHEHMDHARAVKDYLRLGMPCYMSPGTARALDVEGPARWLTPGQILHVVTWHVLPFSVIHDATEPLGFIIASREGGGPAQVLVYVTDCRYPPPIQGAATHLMVETNYSLDLMKEKVESGEEERSKKHRVIWNHNSIETFLDWLEVFNTQHLKEVWLLHLSDTNSDEALFKRLVEEAAPGCQVHVA